MKVAWINPRFLHYRIPVYHELNKILENQLTIIFSAERVPADVLSNTQTALGNNAVALEREKIFRIGRHSDQNFSNKSLQVPFQKGLVDKISTVNPDVIISEGFFQWTPYALWASRQKKIPLIIAYERTAHTERNAGRLRTIYRKFIAKYADFVCCNGILSKDYCVEVLGISEGNVITGAMAADNYSIQRSLSYLTEDVIHKLQRKLNLLRPVYLYVGRLARPKGLRELIWAWKRHCELSANPGSLLIIGQGSEKDFLEMTIKTHNLKNVILAGHIEYSDIALYYAVSDILVMPTLEDNWSLVVPEAMSCSKAILCSCYNGCWPELIKEGVNGYVFDPLDINQFSLMLKKCSDTRESLPLMGRESYQIVKKFTPTKVAQVFFDACQRAVKGRLQK